MTTNDDKMNDKVDNIESSTRHNTGGRQKSIVRDIVDVIKEHPSIGKYAKYFGAYYIFLQLFGIILFVIIFWKIFSAFDGHREDKDSMSRELDKHIKAFNKKFDDERERKRQELVKNITASRRRMDSIRDLVDDQFDFGEEAMIILRDDREERHVKFKKDMMHASDKEMAHVYAEKAKWDKERDAKLKVIHDRKAERKLKSQKEEEDLLVLEKELQEMTAPMTTPEADQKNEKKEDL